MKGEIPHPNPEVSPSLPRIMPRRENFGPGDVGDYAFKLIEKGVVCETEVDIADGKPVRCGLPAIGVVNFTPSLEGYEVIPCCSGVHALEVKTVIESQAEKSGRSIDIGWNGDLLNIGWNGNKLYGD